MTHADRGASSGARIGLAVAARRALRLAGALASALVLGACGMLVVPEGSDLVDLPLGTWVRLPLGGDAVCADGSGYAAQVRRGSDAGELVVAFQGGGATWGEIEGASWLVQRFLAELYLEKVRSVRTAGLADPPADDPLAEATQVLVSYCSGDVHWGDASGVDAMGTAIEHRGAANVEAVLDWLAAQGLAPERLTVAGCSAGAYGALLWAPSLAELFPDATRSLLLDAALGAVQAPFLTGPAGLPSWRVERAFAANGQAQLLDTLDVGYFERLVGSVAPAFGGPIGVASTDRDGVQAAFHFLMGEAPQVTDFGRADVDDWSEAAVSRLGRLADIEGVTTFASDWGPMPLPYGATGHCVTENRDLWRPGMGDAFRDWWGELRAGHLPDPVDLRGD